MKYLAGYLDQKAKENKTKMSSLESLLAGVDSAKQLGGYTPNFVNGNHTVLIKRFNVKTSAKDGSKIVEGDFYILESDTEAPKSVKGTAWFIDAPKFAGDYARSRLQAFAKVVQECIGDSCAPSQTIAQLVGEAQLGRGLMLKCRVFDGSPRKDGKGNYQEIRWEAVPQTLEDIQKNRAMLEGTAAGAHAQTATTQATSTVSQPAAGNQGMSKLLGKLGG